ncbi:helix-hairpin-helix domain-containing protein [Leifsonia shinshuensis]|uniref:ComEA family DNA-binding protein n=1 Tax=Leifsonia shinshuensis TaxID=150026 RepID=UPI00285BF678|nr:helix-hairpin-helix domain-containing protein [Leifsonia shinshuensis]MDR6970448.1 competence protein ComEA [Leifsonia shinshuensis]
MRHRAHPSAADDAMDADLSAAGASPTAPRRLRLGVGAAVVLLILAGVLAVLVSAGAQQGHSVGLPTPTARSSVRAGLDASGTPLPNAGGSVLVHVTGAVRKPGLVSLAPGARVVDAVAAAGGLTDDAEAAGVNLARPVADGEQLVVPRVGETAPAAAPGAGGAGTSATGSAPPAGATVNLNTATQAELETLPRIGPALAQRILDWRQANGRFAQVTDLMKVTGIGQKLFDGLKDRVVV